MSSHTLCSFHVAWSNICHVYFSAPCFDEEVHPITDVCFLPPTSWWNPQLVGSTSCERRETYTHNRVYFLHFDTHSYFFFFFSSFYSQFPICKIIKNYPITYEMKPRTRNSNPPPPSTSKVGLLRTKIFFVDFEKLLEAILFYFILFYIFFR